jgi:hypothetical protein
VPDEQQVTQHQKLVGWRKYSIAFLGLAMGFVLAIFGKLTGEFSTIVTVVVGSYQAANAATHFAKNGKS